MEKIGLIPAAGYAHRLGKIGGSKEMIPVKDLYGLEPVCDSLIRQFDTAGIKNIVLVTRKDKTDLLDHINFNLSLNVEITTILLETTGSTIESICSAYELVRGKEVYLGFPDMIISPVNAMRTLLKAKESSSAEVVLGGFPTRNARKVDMIEIGPGNKLVDIVIKNPECSYKYAWIIACWKKNFTEYLYSYFHSGDIRNSDNEVYIGNIFLSYLTAGHRIEVHRVIGGKYVDIGTPEDLAGLAYE